MKRCFIFSAGSFYGLREEPKAGDLVLAADAGYEHCLRLGIRPDQLMGDFDSMEQPKDFANVVRMPVEKDDTDTMLAIKAGLAQGCTEFYLYGASGGKRMDHTIANLQGLLYLRRHGAQGWLYDDDFVWTVIENESLTVKREVEWGLLSVFCLGERAEGVTERGVQYQITDVEVSSEVPFGVSNHILDECATISVQKGALLIGWELPHVIH